MKKIEQSMLDLIKFSISVIILVFASLSFAQTRLWGVIVWEYDDGSIVVQHQGANKYYYPADGSMPPPNPQCASRPVEAPLTRDKYLYTETINPSRSAGGATYSIDLSRFYNPKKVQIRVLRGTIQIHSAELTDSMNNYASLSGLVTTRLCENQSITASLNSLKHPQKLELKIEGYIQNNVTVEVLVQYDKATCGGCNVYGCWIQGGGCNVYGCYAEGNGCNVYGCYISGGGCNAYGCWYPGGYCDVNGCLKKAPTTEGRESDHPVCE